MHPFLIAAVASVLALFFAAVEPNARAVRALKAGAVAALLGTLAAWAWPMHVAGVLTAAFALAVLQVFAHVVFWPVRFVGQLLRGD